ncbi:MAG: AAA family ATPase, partial [Deltaproteobacteria bacterium]|nr:AAA family ATPase [Deltaproteobacteria bacterium]
MEIGGDFFTSQGPPKAEQIIEISGFQRVRQRLEINIERKKGNIILIIGTRGIGKSTALEYFKEYSNNILKYDCSRFLDIGLHIPKLLDKDYNERGPYILKEIALVLSDNKEDDISKVIETLDKYEKGPFFLFIDNLDRLYQNKDDLGFVNYFFQTADPTLKALSKKVVIVISCAPEWNIFLEQRDLSYMNFSNSITLEPLSSDEIKKLIESRANSDGFKIEEIIETNLLPILQVASRGNPRSV